MTAIATGHAAALAHGKSRWAGTETYRRERFERLILARAHLRELAPLFQNDPNYQSLLRLLDQAQTKLDRGFPTELPFLPSLPGAPQRLRIAVVLREWLLSSRHPRREEHLRDFLEGYQSVSPLRSAEIRLMQAALQLALTEKCHLLPSARCSQHVELLPRLLRRLAETAAFIATVNWPALGEMVSRVHLLLRQDPAHTYDRLDFKARDACRRSVEELSRIFQTSESQTVQNAMALAEKRETSVNTFLLGPERDRLIETLAAVQRADGQSENPQAAAG